MFVISCSLRAFFKVLNQEWPFWLWFLTRNSGSIALLLSLICEIDVFRDKKGSVGTAFKNTQEFKDSMADMMRRSEALYIIYGIPNDDVQASLKSALEELFL
jgi:hypothetical protein